MWFKIQVYSGTAYITSDPSLQMCCIFSNLLLGIGLPSLTCGRDACEAWQSRSSRHLRFELSQFASHQFEQGYCFKIKLSCKML